MIPQGEVVMSRPIFESTRGGSRVGRWLPPVLLAAVALVGCEPDPIVTDLGIRLGPCLLGGETGVDGGVAVESNCRDNLEQAVAEGTVNACLVARGAAGDVRRIPLHWDGERLTQPRGGELGFDRGERFDAALFFLAEADDSGAICNAYSPADRCADDARCVLKLIESGATLAADGTTVLDFTDDAGRCVSESGPPFVGEGGSAEACDGMDNDCDRNIDEGFALGERCAVASGVYEVEAAPAECRAEGETVCNEAGDGVTCGATMRPIGSEGCEERAGLDDDCDGRVDENLPCFACPDDAACAGHPDGAQCVAGRCEACDPDTDDFPGCEAAELCCRSGADIVCLEGALDACTGCRGGACDRDAADGCTDRVCTCGEASACSGGTPFCVGGACLQCRGDDDCGPDQLCCGGFCIDTDLEDSCLACGQGCDTTNADNCTGRACRCGGGRPCAAPTPVCDPAASGSCVECARNVHCQGLAERPVCDVGARICVPCLDDQQCDGARPECVDRACVECDPAPAEGDEAAYRCDEAGDAPICVSGICRACEVHRDCADRPGDFDYCVDGRCRPCDPEGDLGCADPAAPICDPEATTCRGCLERAECNENLAPAVAIQECAPDGRCVGCVPLADDGTPNLGCAPADGRPICDADDELCRACASDDECPAQAPFDDAEADGEALTLCVDGRCRACRPATDDTPQDGCRPDGPTPFCAGGECVPCASDDQCAAVPGAEGICVEGTCRACDPDDPQQRGCDDLNFPVCDPDSFTCRACDLAGECPPLADGRPTRCIEGVCTECDVDGNAGCDTTGDAPVCADDDGDGITACRACLDDGECARAAAAGPGARVQCVDGRCLACDQSDNAPCDVGGPAPVCRRDVDGAFRCLPCAGDAECALVAPGTPQCVGGGCEVCDPVGEGAFDDVGCAAPTAVCDEGIADCRGCMSDDECPGASLCRQNGTCSGCDPADGDRGCDPASPAPVCDVDRAECRGCAEDAECAGNPQGELCVGGTCQPCDRGDHRGCGLDTLCCGDGVPSCVPTTPESCAACDVACVGANRCVDRVCQCGDEGACGGLQPFCEGAAPAGRCVSCFTDDDCAIPGYGQCLDGACVACDPRVGEGAAGCAPDEGRPYCDPGIDACVSCEGEDDRCVEQVGRPECVGDSCFECDPDDPASDTGQTGCDTASDTPYCDTDQGNTCVGCGGEDDRCLAAARTQCVGDGCFECDPRVLQGYAGCDPLSDAPFCAPDSSTCQACTVDRECDESPGGGQCVGDFCRVCDPGDHEGCNDDSLCCVDGIPGCRATDFAVECEACGVPCDPVTADNCTDRACRCGEAAACADGTPFCVDSVCVECVADGDCGDGTICVDNVCRACDPTDNRNCVADSDAPVCDSGAFTCRGCGANAECDGGSGPAANVNGPICLDSGACRVCDPIAGDDQHEGCLADELCCPADGTPRCEDTAPDGQCEECGTACDPQVANRCADRSCVCGDTDAACDAEGDLPYCNGDDCVECIEDAHCGDGALCVDFVCRACDPRDDRGCEEDSATPVCDGDDFVCRGCAANAECDGTSGPDANVNGPICLDSGACRVCDPVGGDDQHEGCEASELCCDADGTPECQATGPDAQCTACGEACPPRSADQCADRVCACGDAAACADGTPYCVGGACEQCEFDADCGGDTPLCVDNVCVECNPGTGEGCDPDGDTPICGDDSTCRACQANPECAGNENGPTCLGSGQCRICDVTDHDGCGGEELCCEIGGAPRCQATDFEGACEACDDGICDPASADACEGRLCVCGDTGAACADPNPFCVDGACEECVADGDCAGDDICVGNACVECDPADDRGCDPNGVAPTCGGDFACGACGVDADCAANGNGPTCTDTGACRACDLADHDGCEDGELCCGADGAQACEATAFDGQCEACGERCDADAADTCEGRACTCGGDPACAGGTPFCVDGACAECRDDADCGGGQCVAGVCGACDPAGDVGCDPDGAAPICGDDLTCRGCQGNLECVGNANGEVCVADTGACRTCDVGDHDGCGADELCCDQGGTPTCEATDPGAQCEVCGQTCDADAADTCEGRACTCGGAPACADGTPFCEGGGCVECRDGQGDCVGDPDGEVCVAGVCEECDGDGDCPDGFCVNNACVECRSGQGDCQDGEFCFSGSCVECVLTLNCDGGFVCQAGQCVCDEDADCADGEVCCDGACQMDACDP